MDTNSGKKTHTNYDYIRRTLLKSVYYVKRIASVQRSKIRWLRTLHHLYIEVYLWGAFQQDCDSIYVPVPLKKCRMPLFDNYWSSFGALSKKLYD